MVGVWLVFAALLFVIEPLIIRRTVSGHTAEPPRATLAKMQWIHGVMLASMIAVFAPLPGATVSFEVRWHDIQCLVFGFAPD